MASTDIAPANTNEADLLATLRRYWGYGAFRPLQERVVRSLLGGTRQLRGDADRRRKVALLPACRR